MKLKELTGAIDVENCKLTMTNDGLDGRQPRLSSRPKVQFPMGPTCWSRPQRPWFSFSLQTVSGA
jgi:hypothetical protein